MLSGAQTNDSSQQGSLVSCVVASIESSLIIYIVIEVDVQTVMVSGDPYSSQYFFQGGIQVRTFVLFVFNCADLLVFSLITDRVFL